MVKIRIFLLYDGYSLSNEILNLNKTHGHDLISFRMLNIWGFSACKPLEFPFKPCIEGETYPSEWIKVNAVAVHKKRFILKCLNFLQITN